MKPPSDRPSKVVNFACPLLTRREALGLAAGGGARVLTLGQSVEKSPDPVANTTAQAVPLKVLRLPNSRLPLANIDGRLVRTKGGQTIVIEPWGKDGLRVRVSKSEIYDTPWALTEPAKSGGSIEISKDGAIIRNGIISVRIQDKEGSEQGLLSFFRQTATGEECILSEYNYFARDYVLHPGPRIMRQTNEGLYHAEIHFEPSDGERFYGLGQNASGCLDQKGFVIDLFQRHEKAIVPFLVSNKGYGFLWNNPGLGRVDLGYNRTRWTAYGCNQIDYYVCAGNSYGAIMERYAEATGHPPMLPYWASGFWQSKARYKTQEELLGVAREYKRRNLPLSVIVIDWFHWKHLGDWKLDPAFWPDAAAMVRELAAMGVRVMVSPWILVSQKSENYPEMKRRRMFITSDRGATVEYLSALSSKDDPEVSDLAHYDSTNPEAARFLWSKWKQNYFDYGIRTFWLDPCDTVYDIDDYAGLRYHIGRGVEVNCCFPIAHQKAIHDGLKAAGESEVVTICRSVWAGSQRYGAALWSGDIESSFKSLYDHVKVGLNVGMSGIPWWTTDVGGTYGGDVNSPMFRELIVRWYQYGIFCPLLRTHGFRPGNEAWSFGEEAYRHIRRAMLLRERLRSYVMEQMKLAHDKGMPPMRPLFFDFPDDPEAAQIEDQFLFGADLLIAPILKYEARSREVYLPAAAAWTDVWTGGKFEGGIPICAAAPLEHIPVYVRNNREDLGKLFRDL